MSKARSLGFSPERLARIDGFLRDTYVGPGRMPCAQFLLLRGGEIAHQTVLGFQDVERQVPLAEDNVFRIYSMTKPLTSVAFMMLVEEGKAALDDPVSRYIPAWEGLGVFQAGSEGGWTTSAPARPMLIADLLRHTSGLTYGFQERTSLDAAYRRLRTDDIHRGLTLPELITALSDLPLEFSPGEAWNYSVSTDVLGYVIEQVAGRPFQDVLADRILRPLGMTETGFSVREDQRARFTACYQATATGGLKLVDDPTTSPFLGEPRLYSGGGGLVSTAGDYMRFCRMLLNGGELEGARILAPRTLALMTANHLPGGGDLTQMSRSLFSESTNAGVGFGLGFATVFDPVKALSASSVGEFYWGGMASTAFWVDSAQDLAAVFMTQLLPSSAYPVRRQLRSLTYAALIDPS